MALKSKSTFNENVLTFACNDEESGGGFERKIDMTTFAPGASGLVLAALVFALKTALRNSTGGKEIEEAEENVDARLAAWSRGEWGAERSGGGDGEVVAFTPGNILAKAVQRVYASRFADGAAAAAALNEMLAAQLTAQGAPAFADLDEDKQKAARNGFTKAVRGKDAAVDAAVAAIQAEQAAARQAKKASAAANASGGLFA